MIIKRTVCAFTAGVMLIGSAAMAKDNIYAYNKFVSTVLGPQKGYCDFALSFAGHESEYDNVNDFFSGLISAFYDDIDADLDNELVTVDTRGVTIYRVGEKEVEYLGAANTELIADFGDSYANIFTVPSGKKQFIGIEKYDKTYNRYEFYLYELNPETDEFAKALEISREDNEDGLEENVWAAGKTYYNHTNAAGLQTSINSDGYADCTEAAVKALSDIAPEAKLGADVMKDRINGLSDSQTMRLTAEGISLKTYIRATGVRLTPNPVVIFEDMTRLSELREVPEIVTVTVDGQVLDFPTQDPIIIDGRTLVPMRTIFEALGADVEWRDEDGVQSIIASTEETAINMIINNAEYTVNGEIKTLDVPAQLINDKTMVPIRAISESLGCLVDWDDGSKTVIIQSAIAEIPDEE